LLAALNHRNVTGEGQRIEVNLLSSLLSAMVNQASSYVSGGVVPGILGNAHPSISPYEVYKTSDRPIVVAVGNDGQFAKLCQELEIPEVSTDAKFATNPDRVANRVELNDLLVTQFLTHGADHWWKSLSSAGVPCGPINSISEAFELAESLDLNPIITISQEGEERKQVANPITFSQTPVRYAVAPPSLASRYKSNASACDIGFDTSRKCTLATSSVACGVLNRTVNRSEPNTIDTPPPPAGPSCIRVIFRKGKR
jgi:crotonobetainyl-CoA:carnitine CoA-transferase CaiB-like acyl-CoA transferase